MSYTTEYLEEALPLLWGDPSVTPQTAREQGMPRARVDPRTSMDGIVGMIDVRVAWKRCTWLTLDQRRAVFAVATSGTQDEASELLGVPQRTISDRYRAGLNILADWLGSTVADREAWEREVAEAA